MLAAHPQIHMSPVKEPCFFIAEMLRNQPSGEQTRRIAQEYEARGRYRTLEPYLMLFDAPDGVLYRGESSHYLYNPKVIPFIEGACSDPRFMVCVRDPVQRFLSEYRFKLRQQAEERDLYAYTSHAIESYARGASDTLGLRKGFQTKLIRPWIDAFGSHALFVMSFERLASDPALLGREACRWLGIREDALSTRIHLEAGSMPDSVHAVMRSKIEIRCRAQTTSSDSLQDKAPKPNRFDRQGQAR